MKISFYRSERKKDGDLQEFRDFYDEDHILEFFAMVVPYLSGRVASSLTFEDDGTLVSRSFRLDIKY